MFSPQLPVLFLHQTLKGPDDTPYAGGIFEVDINIPNDYPFSPPKMKFITKGTLISNCLGPCILSSQCFIPIFLLKPEPSVWTY